MNHPCKELIWVIQRDDNVASGANRWSDYTNSGIGGGDEYNGGDTLVDAKLQLNGHDRFSTRKAGYFNLVKYARNSNEWGALESALVHC